MTLKGYSRYNKKLVTFLQQCADTYYNDSRTIITDGEYDALMDRLALYEQYYPILVDPKSPTRTVGASVTIRENESIVEHKPALQSLAKTNTVEELQHWLKKSLAELAKSGIMTKHITMSLEHKLDGLMCRAIYRKGDLTSLSLRGDGHEGAEMINTIKLLRKRPDFRLKGLPLRVVPMPPDPQWDGDYVTNFLTPPEYLDICGELVISRDDFKAVNKLLMNNGQPPYPTPRHAAGALVSLRSFNYLTFVLHSVNSLQIKDGRKQIEVFENYLDAVAWLTTTSHFRTVPFMPIRLKDHDYWDQIIQNLSILAERRKNDPEFTTDGAVLKFTETAHRELLGKTRKAPRWAIAFKFPNEAATTKLLDVAWGIGRTGVLTPVAQLEPVEIGNVCITKATISNPFILKKLDLHINDHVLVHRANDVIPKILGAIPELRDETVKKIEVPEHCFICGEELKIIGSELYCPNRQCNGQLLAQLAYAASRAVFDLKFMSQKLISGLFESGVVSRPEHFFMITKKDVPESISCSPAVLKTVFKYITRSREKKLTPVTALMSLSIPLLSKASCEEVIHHVGSLRRLLSTRVDKELLRKSKMWRTLYDYMSDEQIKTSLKVFSDMLEK
jgi:NAD-dependent DNA ligase (contains BRCT domain type II)